MKQGFLSKFASIRSSGFAPSGWPTDDVVEIDASANELKKITADVIKKLALCMPPQSSSVLHSLDLTSFSLDSLQSSGNNGDKHATNSSKIEDRRYKLNSSINYIESNGFCGTRHDKKSHDADVTSEGDSFSCYVTSSKENPKNIDMIESRIFTGNSTSEPAYSEFNLGETQIKEFP
ncbi:hypothetical protein ACTXT7_012254 [Hymenolepis weldensis]